MAFQSTPPAEAEGDDGISAELLARLFVSIHSPRRSGGRRKTRPGAEWVVEFQSTPPAEAEGDWSMARVPLPKFVFQSTPPAEAEGDLGKVLEAGLRLPVSIHSPRRSGGRPAMGR